MIKRQQTLKNLMENMGALMKLMGKSQRPLRHKKGPTRAQLGALMMISHLGMQTIKDLSLRLEMTSSAATQLVDGLVKEKLLTRTEDKRDRRKTKLALTAHGHTKLNQAKKERLNFLAKLFKPLDIKDLENLQVIQHKIMKVLNTHARQ